MGAARTKAGVLASIRALPTLPRSNHDAKRVLNRLTNMTVSRGLRVCLSGKSPADARRTDGHARASASRAGLPSDPPKSGHAKPSRVGLPILGKFDDSRRPWPFVRQRCNAAERVRMFCFCPQDFMLLAWRTPCEGFRP